MRKWSAGGKRMRRAGLAVACLAASGWIASSAVAKNPGIDTSQMTTSGPVSCNGVLCHTTASPNIIVTISGPGELMLGETRDYRIELTEIFPNPAHLGAGVNVSAFLDGVLTGIEDGVLGTAPNDPASQITGFPPFLGTGQLTHFFATTTANGKFFYDFTVTAPDEPGTLELRGAMNAFDGNLLPTGDAWNSTSLFVAVPEPATPALGLAALATLAALHRRSGTDRVRSRP